MWAAKSMNECDLDGSKTLDFKEFKTLFAKSGTLRAAAKMPKVKTVEYNYEKSGSMVSVPKTDIKEGDRVKVTSGSNADKCGSVVKVRTSEGGSRFKVTIDGNDKPTWLETVDIEKI